MSALERVYWLRYSAKILLFLRRLAEGRNGERSLEVEQSIGLLVDGLKLWGISRMRSKNSSGGGLLRHSALLIRLLGISGRMQARRARKSCPTGNPSGGDGGIYPQLASLFHVEHSTCSLGRLRILLASFGTLISLARVLLEMRKSDS